MIIIIIIMVKGCVCGWEQLRAAALQRIEGAFVPAYEVAGTNW